MTKLSNQDITLYAVGDVGPERDDPGSIFRHVKDVIQKGDVTFTQLEVNLSHRGSGGMKENARDPRIAGAIKKAGFNVVSFASNHSLDAGVEAFYDTLDNLKKENLQVIGAGRNIEEARRPAFIEAKGTRVAFLGYNSILKEGYWAEEKRPGCAPLRAYTLYEQMVPSQPGTPARIHTFPYRNDLENDAGRYPQGQAAGRCGSGLHALRGTYDSSSDRRISTGSSPCRHRCRSGPGITPSCPYIERH